MWLCACVCSFRAHNRARVIRVRSEPSDRKWYPDTMKLYSLSILHKGATRANLLKAAYELTSFGFFQRSRWDSPAPIHCLVPLCLCSSYSLCVCCSVQEFMTFTSALIVERSTQGSRASVKEQGRMFSPGWIWDNVWTIVEPIKFILIWHQKCWDTFQYSLTNFGML